MSKVAEQMNQNNNKSEYPVFVYGTLKKGYYANNFIADQEFLGTATCPGSIADLGPFPCFVDAGPGVVQGELYHTTEEVMARLDAYEGVPRLYKRITKEVTLQNAELGDKVLTAWIYEISEIPGNFDHIRIPNGKWDKKTRGC